MQKYCTLVEIFRNQVPIILRSDVGFLFKLIFRHPILLDGRPSQNCCTISRIIERQVPFSSGTRRPIHLMLERSTLLDGRPFQKYHKQRALLEYFWMAASIAHAPV